MTNSKWDAFLVECKEKHPKFSLVRKEDSTLMKVIFYATGMWLWCPDFLTHFTTTLGQTVYMPSGLIGTGDGYCTLRHEEVHIADSRRWPVLFQLSYLGPIPIGPFSARWYWEFRAYKETLRAWHDTYASGISDDDIEWLVGDIFAGSSYLWMFPFKKTMRRWLQAERIKIEADE